MAGRSLPEAVKTQALGLYQQGMSSIEISTQLGCSYSIVCRWLRKANVPRRSKTEHLKGLKNPTRGKKRPPEIVAKLVEASRQRRGNRHYNWKGGVSPLNDLVRARLKLWTQAVFRRDGYTCQGCGQKHKDIEAHHIVTFSELMAQVHPGNPRDLPLDQQADLIATHPSFQDLANGVTVCHSCHELLHGKAHGRRR